MSKGFETKLQELSVAPEYKNALIAFLEAIRQDEKLIEMMIGEEKEG